MPAALAAVFLLLCGCIPSLHTPYEAGPWLRPPTPVAVAFNPRPPLADIGLELLRERSDGYAVYAFDFPSVDFNRQPGNRVRGRYYRSSKGGKRSLLVLLPIWGKSTYPVMTTVRHLLHGPSAGSLDLVVLEGKRHLFDWKAMAHAGSEAAVEEEIQRWVRSLQATVTDIRRLIEWGRRQPEIDPRRIGIVGYSVSAVVAGLVIGLEPRLAAGALVMTGGHLGEILERCDIDANRVRRGLERRLGWSAEEMRRKLAPFLDPYHPVRYAGAVDPASVLFIDAARDACMTAADRERYWQALGRPERITIGWTHRLSFLSMTPLGGHATTRKIVDFLHRRLVAPEAEPSEGRRPWTPRSSSNLRPGVTWNSRQAPCGHRPQCCSWPAYGTLLDHAEVSPDSKPSARGCQITRASFQAQFPPCSRRKTTMK